MLLKSITNRQMGFIIFLTLTTYTSIGLPKIMAQSVGRSSWILLLASAIIFGIVAVLITKLNNMFLGKTFFEYSRDTTGKLFAYMIAFYFILYFLFVGIQLKLQFADLITSNFLPKTPQFVILFICILLFAYVSNKGITNIARLFEIFGMMFLIITVCLCVIMLFQGMSANVLPFFNANEAKHYLKSSKYFIEPYGGLAVLLIIPFAKINKKAPKTAFLTVFFIGLFYILIVESTLMIFGVNNTMALNDPFIEAIKLVDAPVIERLDILYLTFGVSSLFAGMIIVFTAVTEFVCGIFSKARRKIAVIIIGLILYILFLFAMKIKNFNEIYTAVIPYFILTSCVIIPAITLIAAKVKKKQSDSFQEGK